MFCIRNIEVSIVLYLDCIYSLSKTPGKLSGLEAAREHYNLSDIKMMNSITVKILIKMK